MRLQYGQWEEGKKTLEQQAQVQEQAQEQASVLVVMNGAAKDEVVAQKKAVQVWHCSCVCMRASAGLCLCAPLTK